MRTEPMVLLLAYSYGCAPLCHIWKARFEMLLDRAKEVSVWAVSFAAAFLVSTDVDQHPCSPIAVSFEHFDRCYFMQNGMQKPFIEHCINTMYAQRVLCCTHTPFGVHYHKNLSIYEFLQANFHTILNLQKPTGWIVRWNCTEHESERDGEIERRTERMSRNFGVRENRVHLCVCVCENDAEWKTLQELVCQFLEIHTISHCIALPQMCWCHTK